MNNCCYSHWSSFSNYVVGNNTIFPTNTGFEKRIFFDNGATTLVSKVVADKINSILPYYTYIGVDDYPSQKLTKEYIDTRDVVKKFLGADQQKDTTIFVKTATYGINVFANAILQEDPNQIVLVSQMEHLANYMPYKQRLNIQLIGLLPDGNIDLKDYEAKLKLYQGKVKYVCITGATNITGIVTPYYEMAKLAHQYGARLFLDAAQLIQHKPFDMKPHDHPEHIDFVTFSAHKAYTGLDSGALVGPLEFFKKYMPLEFGSTTPKFVSTEKVIYADPPSLYEPGYPNLIGVLAMKASLESLSSIGLDKISTFEAGLRKYLLDGLKKIPNIILYGTEANSPYIPFISFNIKGITPSVIRKRLGYEYAIAVTSGTIGSNLYVEFLLGLSPEQAYKLYESGTEFGVIRVSLAFYNTYQEIDKFLSALNTIVTNIYATTPILPQN